MRGKLLGPLNAQQPAGKACIQHKELGRLERAFLEIAVVRGQSMDDVTGLQYRQPLTNRIVADAHGITQRRLIQQLLGAPGHQRGLITDVTTGVRACSFGAWLTRSSS